MLDIYNLPILVILFSSSSLRCVYKLYTLSIHILISVVIFNILLYCSFLSKEKVFLTIVFSILSDYKIKKSYTMSPRFFCINSLNCFSLFGNEVIFIKSVIFCKISAGVNFSWSYTKIFAPAIICP